mmetsp:Transcript_37137/g.90276  ORF Transcript_37137/g.90276 Transcript_37137/m.90276 type:complete len:135 (-) Transcript_37137:558-962(-)|eukprot:CAMPEP_0113635516 /NCGR_PEP_ID=MMETSP0017_2-20120614/18517_1 /TAXON_ID=2856 /ORGANISM="Cylindrotheca closterium" /LENGTH=134 /DNA_ID=CAMNT_0000546307 /DNA_START=98 /DNA_END=502 /DNA_ORIENTATION=- /assembly_acc=CAM_ASM_000147
MTLMRPRNRFAVWSILLLLLSIVSSPSVLVSAEEESEPFVEESILWAGLDDPDAILLKEIEWAQKSMERYYQKNGAYPSRSDDSSTKQHTNIYSSEWVQESMDSLRQQELDNSTRDSRWKNRRTRFLRGPVTPG